MSAYLSIFVLVVDLLGVVANGILGGTLARSLRFDPVGFVALAMASALGGGMLRDLLLQAGPPVALTNPTYLGMAVLGAVTAFVVPFRGLWSRRFLLVADAVAMGCWAAVGTLKGLAHQLPPVAAVLLGVITVVGGGIIRDLLVRRVPVIFNTETPLYATCALVGAIETALFVWWHLPGVGMIVSILSCTVMCLLARRRNWRLPGGVEWSRPLRS